MRPVAGLVLRLLLALGLVPVVLLTVTACCPAGGVKADLRAEQRTEDADIGDLLKQSEEDKKRADQAGQKQAGKSEPNGGVNARGNGGPPAGCPPPVGKPGNSGGQFNNKLFGAKGTQIQSQTVGSGTVGRYTYRIDVENPSPGKRAGNMHVQLGGKGSTHYYYRSNGKFTTKDGETLPKNVREHLATDPQAQMDIAKGLRLLGED